MAGRPQVSIRLATSGKAEVQKDFVEIADAGGAQAARLRAKFESETAAIERATERAAKTAARLATVSVSPIQQQINQATGVGGGGSNAKAAAAALAAELDRAENEARQLRAAIDPLFAAQSRYTAQVEQINRLKSMGVLSEETYLKLLASEKSLLDQATASGMRNAQMRGTMRMGMQQLSFQANDVAMQMALGTNAARIFAQQSGQVVQALQIMGGEGNAFLKFIGGPWGLALTTAAVVLAPFIGKLFDAGVAIDDLVEKERKQVKQQAESDRAHELFARTLDGVAQSLHAVEKAYDEYENRLKSSAQAELDAAKNALAIARARRAEAEATIGAARAEIERQNALAIGAETKGRVDPRLVAADAARGRIDTAQAQLGIADANIQRAQQDIEKWQSIVTVERASADEVERIRQKFEGQNGLIEKARQHALAQHKVGDELERQVRALKAQEAAQIKAVQERDRKGPANAGGTAIFNEQIASFFDEAAKFRGMSETSNKGVLEAFFREANLSLDPEKTAWCAAFVNAVLANQGVKGTGSLAAKSFLTFGKDDTKSPQRGDIVVVKSGGGQHVGFLDSIDKAGNVSVLGGNTGNRVGNATYGKGAVLAIRRPPTPSESASAADKAAADAIQAQKAFDTERKQLNDQLLRELAQVAVGYEQQATVQLRIAQQAHDDEAKEIAASLAAGQYGEATSQLAQTRARQLQTANDDLLLQRQAHIALDGYVKSLQAQDAKNEQLAQFQIDELEFAEKHARTAQQHLDLQLQIIDKMFEEKESHLKYLLALAQLNGETEKAAEKQREINNLPKEKARAQGDARDSNKSPGREYLDSLPKLSELSGNLETIGVNALKSFNEQLANAIMNSKSLKDLWHNLGGVIHSVAQQILKDLIDLAIKMLIIRPIMNAIAGGGGFATGTEYAPGGMSWVGENGPELVALPRGSKVHSAASSSRMAQAANDSGPRLSLTVHNDFRGADPEAVSAVKARVDQFENDFPGRVVATMRDARGRFVWR